MMLISMEMQKLYIHCGNSVIHKRLYKKSKRRCGMKTRILFTLFILALALAACQFAAPIPPAATLTPEPPTLAPTITPTATITPTPTIGPGGFPRRFHAEGNAFVDQFGQPMIFRGVAAEDPALQSLSGDPTYPAWDANYYHVMASWGANIVRIMIVPPGLHAYGLDAELKALDQAIAWAGENHMYVIIDFHLVGWIPGNYYPSGGGFDTTLGEWTAFWKAVSIRYANNDVVAFYELFNEPAVPPVYGIPSTLGYWMTWKGLNEALINETIRPNDPHKTVLVSGLMSAFDLSYVPGASIVDISNNVGYSVHPYPPYIRNGINWDKAFGNLSKTNAIFATEYFFTAGSVEDDPLVGGIPYHQVVMNYLEAHHINWTAHYFGNNWGPGLVKNNLTYEPSGEGAFFMDLLMKFNLPGVPTPTLPPPLPSPVGKPGDLAHGKPVSASSIQSLEYQAKNAVDGDVLTYWGSSWSDPQWFQVDLGSIFQINRVVLNWQTSHALAYLLQVSGDGLIWQTIYSTTQCRGGIEDLSVNGSGRYVRMYGIDRAKVDESYYGYALQEFEVYGTL
jgi:endoglucanase